MRDIMVSDNIMMEVFGIFVLYIVVMIFFAGRLESFLFSNMKAPCIVRGKIIEIRKVPFGGGKGFNFSGYDYAVVEYVYQSKKCNAKIMSAKSDYISREVDLAIDSSNEKIVVRKEREITKCILLSYFLIVFVFVFIQQNISSIGFISLVLLFFAVSFMARKQIAMYLYEHRSGEWKSDITFEGKEKLPTWFVIIVFLLCFITLLSLVMSY